MVRQLEEVRGRVVEVMEEKVELAGRVESWEGRGRGWEQVRSELEVKAEEAAVSRQHHFLPGSALMSPGIT